jgi:hypothetical protein
MKQIKKEITFWARQCSVTQQGMIAGYVWGDGTHYCIDDDSVALPQFREDRDYILDCIPSDISDIIDYDDYYEGDHDEYIQAIERSAESKETDEDLRILSYLFGLHYYTEWLEDDDVQYVEIDGVMYEEGHSEFALAIAEEMVTQTKTI